MDSRLSDFLARAESVLARLEPLLPAVREAVDWERSLAARWHRDGRSGYLQPLEVSLDLRLADLLGVERQREQLERNTRQFVAGQPANHALLWGPADRQVLPGPCAAGRAGRRRAAPDRDRARPPGRPAARGGATARPAAALRAVLRRPLVRCRGRRLPGTQERARRLAGTGAGECAALRHLQPPAPGFGEAERQRELEDGGRRAASQRSGGGQDRLVRPFRPVAVVLSLHPGAFPQRGSPLGGRARGEGRAGLELERGTGEGSDPLGAWRGNRNGRCAYQFSRYWVGKQLLERQA